MTYGLHRKCFFLDFLFLFLMMSVFHMKTERAAFLGIICAMISAILIGKSTPQIVTTDLEKGAFSALNILIVIWRQYSFMK